MILLLTTKYQVKIIFPPKYILVTVTTIGSPGGSLGSPRRDKLLNSNSSSGSPEGSPAPSPASESSSPMSNASYMSSNSALSRTVSTESLTDPGSLEEEPEEIPFETLIDYIESGKGVFGVVME